MGPRINNLTLRALASAALFFSLAEAQILQTLLSTLSSDVAGTYLTVSGLVGAARQDFTVASGAIGLVFDDAKVKVMTEGSGVAVTLRFYISDLHTNAIVFNCQLFPPVTNGDVVQCDRRFSYVSNPVTSPGNYQITVSRAFGSQDATVGFADTNVNYAFTGYNGVAMSGPGYGAITGANSRMLVEVLVTGPLSLPTPSPTASSSASPSISVTTSVSPSYSSSSSVSPSVSPSASVPPSHTPSTTVTPSVTVTPTLTPLPCSAKTRYIQIERPAQFPMAVDEIEVLDHTRRNVARTARVSASSVLGNDNARFGPQFVVDGLINNAAYVRRNMGFWRPATTLGDSEVLTLRFPAPGIRLSELRMMTRGALTSSQLRALDYEIRINGERCTSAQGRGRFTMANSTRPFIYRPHSVIPNVLSISIRRTTDISVSNIEAWGYDPARPLERFNVYNLIASARTAGTLKVSASSSFIPSNLNTAAYRPSNAVDTAAAATTWMSTADDKNPTLTIDLGKEYMVSVIKVWPRRECCYQRNIGAGVRLLDGQKKIKGTASSLLLLANNFVATGQYKSCVIAADEKEVYGYWTVNARGCV